MSNFLTRSISTAALALSLSLTAGAQEPIAVITSNAYSNAGETSEFTIRIGGNNYEDAEAYIEVDGGDGLPVEYTLTPAIFDSDEQTWSYTSVTVPSLKDGQVVKIYGDASQIIYFDIEGIYATSCDVSKLTNLEAFYGSHNLLADLDLSNCTYLQIVEVTDNPFTGETSFLLGSNHPYLALLEMAIIDKVNPAFNLSDYPNLMMFIAYSNYGLYSLDPSGCPNLIQISVDASNVAAIDVTKNSYLAILNVSDSAVSSLDLSGCPNLQQLYISHGGNTHPEATFKEIDISCCPNLQIFSCSYNEIETLDVTKNTALAELFAQYNKLTTIDVSNCTELYSLNLNGNYFNFATLPDNSSNYYEYYYEEKPLPLNRSYAVGMSIDLSDKVLRADSETYARLLDKSGTEISADLYTYADGVISFNSAIADSVYVEFGNTVLPDYPLITTNFVVKTEEEYGQPVKAITLGSSTDNGYPVTFFVGIAGASVTNPKKFMVDLGSGETATYTATSEQFAGTYNVSKKRRTGSGYVIIYTNEGDDLTSLVYEDQPLYLLNTTEASQLREIRVAGTGLYTVDFTANKHLETIVVDNNNLSELILGGSSSTTLKPSLKYVSAAHNLLTSTDITDLNAIEYLDLSYNQLTTFAPYAGEKLKTLNVSNNELTAINLSTCYVLETVNMESNNIVAFKIGTDNPITNFLCADNQLTLQSLPDPSYFSGTYSYAPQADIKIPVIGPGVDLTEQYREVDGYATVYTWVTADGKTLVENVDYTCDKGLIRFINIEVGKIHCELTHGAFPDFAGDKVLKTTEIEAAGMPTNIVAQFVTTDDETAALSFASYKDGSTIYIDWKGTGAELEQYMLTTTYTLFEAYTYKDATVTVYSYDDDPQISVFSILYAGMSSFDASNLKDVYCFTLANTSLPSIVLPPSNKLVELSLDGNQLETIDLSGHENLKTLYLSGNLLSGAFDFSVFQDLEYASIGKNEINAVTLDNPSLVSIDLGSNQLDNIDLSKCPKLEELNISNNLLTSIDLSVAPSLKAIDLSSNYFTYTTLPRPSDNLTLYYYGNQAPIDAYCVDDKVDLSEFAMVEGYATTYRWFVGMPTYDEDLGDLSGEELEVDAEYNTTDGVTVFYQDLDDVVCVMYNELYPNLYLYTNPMSVTDDITDISIDDAAAGEVEYYNLQGMRIYEPTPGSVVIRRQGSTVQKIIVK